MPNHVTNRLTICAEGARLEEILRDIQNDEYGLGSIDFDKIIHMPVSLGVESSSRTADGCCLYLTALNPTSKYQAEGISKMDADTFGQLLSQLNKGSFTPLNSSLSAARIAELTERNDVDLLMTLGHTAIDNKLKYGATDWYDWSCLNWGTKWNAYNFGETEERNKLVFCTAWSRPEPVMLRLSEMFPEVRLEHEWADEDIGNNVGSALYLGGEITELILPAIHSAEAYKMAFDITGTSPADYDMVFNEETGEYEEKSSDGPEMTMT